MLKTSHVTVIDKIAEELKKNPVENILPLFDLLYENPERVETYIPEDNLKKENFKNALILWKGFKVKDKRSRDVFVVAESEKEVEKLLDLLGQDEENEEYLGYSIFVSPEFSHVVERRYPNKKKENFLLFSLTDKENFKSIIKPEHKVERLYPEPQYIKQIKRNWEYSDDEEFIKEKMTNYPFFGIKGEDKLLSYVGSFAKIPSDSFTRVPGYNFLGFAHTEEEIRGEKMRGKGLQTSVSSKMVEYSLKEGMIPAMYIVEDNNTSIRVANKLGFEHVATHVIFSDYK